MTTIAISMVKDEADIIGQTIGHMLTQVDHIIVADNMSTDGTRDILNQYPIEVVDDLESGYYQADKITALAHQAAAQGATWIVPFDADEIWYSGAGRIADVLSATDSGIAVAPLWDHVPTALDTDTDPVHAMGWRWVDRAALHKVACRAHPDLRIEQGNHTAHHNGHWPESVDGLLEIRHFPYRSAEQFVRKARNGAAAYAATNLSDDLGGHWRGYGRILDEQGEQALIDNVFRRWFWRADPTTDTWVDGEKLPDLVYDPAPCPPRS